MTQEGIKENLALIRRALDLPMNASEPASLIAKMEMIASIQGLSAETISYAEGYYNVKLHEVSKMYSGKNSTERKIIFGDSGKTEIFYHTMAEKYNKELHYEIDMLRTLISYVKKDFDAFGK